MSTRQVQPTAAVRGCPKKRALGGVLAVALVLTGLTSASPALAVDPGFP
jgi:hypothetical protein